LRNFFQPDKILQLRELALKEVAGQVERKVESGSGTAQANAARALSRVHQQQRRCGAEDHPQNSAPGELLPQ
jgi:K+-sensing histidine kinase KdpD